jgi:hypothetical protein
VKPYDRDPSDPPLPESTVKAMNQYAFEVYGNLGSRPVRKCLNCGAGVRVSFLPPRFRQLSDEEWAEFKVRFETWRTQDRARLDEWRAEQDSEREEQTAQLTETVLGELLDMEREAGGPQTYPAWAFRQFVKYTIVAQTAPEEVPAIAATFDDPKPERPVYEQALDDALARHGLTFIARDVLGAVTVSPEQWDEMSEQEREALLERPVKNEDP